MKLVGCRVPKRSLTFSLLIFKILLLSPAKRHWLLNRTLYSRPLAFGAGVSFGGSQSKSILGQETQLAVLGTSSCYFIYKGDCSLPLRGRLEGPLGLLLVHKRTRHGSRPPMPRCPYRSILESLSYTRPTNRNWNWSSDATKTRTRPSLMG